MGCWADSVRADQHGFVGQLMLTTRRWAPPHLILAVFSCSLLGLELRYRAWVTETIDLRFVCIEIRMKVVRLDHCNSSAV